MEIPGFHLTNVTAAAGIDFQHNSGAYGGKFLPETLGSGCAFLDYDADGWQDILLINGMDWPGHRRQRSTLKLYKNNRNGTFTDMTKAAGLDIELYGMGVAAADYNNDGFPDIFISCVGQSRLFHNTGKGTFLDVTKTSGLLGKHGFSTSALWFDYDRDGLLDLFVCNYVRWSPEQDVFLQPGRHAQILLHSRSLSRRHLLALPQSRQRNLRGRNRHQRNFRQQFQIPRRSHVRLRPGWLARSSCRE